MRFAAGTVTHGGLSITFALLVGCVGNISAPGDLDAEKGPGEDGRTPGEGSNDPIDGTPDGPNTSAVAVPGPMPLRRLTRFEYTNTVRDLLRLDSAPATLIDLPADLRGSHGFATATPVSEVDVSRLYDNADRLASLAIKTPTKLLPCNPAKTTTTTTTTTTDGEDACARTFIERFGRRAFRRALTGTEIDDLVGLYAAGRKDLGFDFLGAITQVIRGILQAPQFLYRWELGPTAAQVDGTVVRLGPDELASRLSYFLWSSMPDDTLFTAVDSGDLISAEDVAREARRMLTDPRAKQTLATFHRQWLHLREELPNDLARAMDSETIRFIENIFVGGDGKLETLLLSNVSYVNAPLADIYGVPDGVPEINGLDLSERALDPDERFGLFTQAAFLTNTADGVQSHPVRRGVLLLQQLLCGDLPAPPADVPPPQPPQPGLSNRERFVAHEENACARACHGVIDPLGFAFENYDGLGKYRTEDAGKPIDATGKLDLDGKEYSFTSAKDLMPVLAASKTVHDCMVSQWTQFALGRSILPDEAPGLTAAARAFADAGHDMRALLVAVTQTPSFLNRTPAAEEELAP